jgi:hypothetical protein
MKNQNKISNYIAIPGVIIFLIVSIRLIYKMIFLEAKVLAL